MATTRVPSPYVSRTFPSLSIRDLLEAREAYHAHLSQLETVVGTAIGRFREYKGREASSQPRDWKSRADEQPRTFWNSAVTPHSWPCVLVFVNRWYTRQELSRKMDLLVPRRLFLPDGRVVPTCVIYVKEDEGRAAPLGDLRFPTGLIGGGYPVLTDVQGQEHVGSLGCLVTDGDATYALTNRHVTGEVKPGEPRREVFTVVNGKRVRIGVSDSRQEGKRRFGELYEGWPGGRVLANLDAGLIRVDDVSYWTSQVYGLGELGPVVDLHPHTVTLDLIGRNVRAFGGASGPMEGEIHGLFYRYQSVGGYDYVADLLIGPRETAQSLRTRPGDSGTVWCLDPGPGEALEGETGPKPLPAPIAVQWGGHRLVDPGGTEREFQLALGTFLSTVCRVLDVEVVRDHNTGHREYWGKLGHFKVAAKACELVASAKLRKFLAANLDRIAYDDDVLAGKLPTFPRPLAEFVPLSDVPDLVWRKSRQMDRANHFADMDHEGQGQFAGKTLLDLCKKASNVDARVWAAFYDSIGTTADRDRGALPFRVWQMYDEMVAHLKAGKLAEFLCVAGIMAHYAGDACQPLHISQYHDGRTEDERGVHSDFETNMLDRNRAEVIAGVNAALKGASVKAAGQGGHEAAVKTVELMRATYQQLPPLDIIEVYNDADGPKAMWPPLAARTVGTIARGCENLAMLWASAWREGGGDQIPATKLVAIPAKTLMKLYNDKGFSRAMWLDGMVQAGIGVTAGAAPNPGGNGGVAGGRRSRRRRRNG